MVSLAIVVAVAENGTIGKQNGLPWRLPEDLKYFKKTTMGHPVVMGRKTYESIGRPLPGRDNIVITRQEGWSVEGVQIAHSIGDAIVQASACATSRRVEQIMVIGGAELYTRVLPQCECLYLTEVHSIVEGDAFFPEFDRNLWVEISRQFHSASEVNPYPYSFVVLKRSS
ncbi:MAG: dihydrofolate reductase [Lentisphaeria bacterium]|jgi:dihydrofolate reductase